MSKPSRATGPMDVALLEQIVQLMSANDLNTVDLRDGDKRVILKRGANVVQYAPAMAQPAMAFPPAAPASQPSAGASASSASEAAADAADSKLIPIKSPMVGTFYAAPKQGEKPFVSVGSSVNEETDVCIIEAMKVFNVIKAETGGTIAKVMIQDGQPVEHGTVLFLVRPA
jgi:acetyl-CoA carboxylase biotin carboxyl carrier protein